MQRIDFFDVDSMILFLKVYGTDEYLGSTVLIDFNQACVTTDYIAQFAEFRITDHFGGKISKLPDTKYITIPVDLIYIIFYLSLFIFTGYYVYKM